MTFPLEVFPVWLQPVIRYSPVYAAVSGPVKMLVNFNINEFYGVLVSQLFYVFILVLIITIEYKKGVKKLNVNGG